MAHSWPQHSGEPSFCNLGLGVVVRSSGAQQGAGAAAAGAEDGPCGPYGGGPLGPRFDVSQQGSWNREAHGNRAGVLDPKARGSAQEPASQAAGGLRPESEEPPPRHKFLPAEEEQLERVFRKTQYVTGHLRYEIARSLNVAETRVQSWFKNRRAKDRRHLKRVMILYGPLIPLDQVELRMEH